MGSSRLYLDITQRSITAVVTPSGSRPVSIDLADPPDEPGGRFVRALEVLAETADISRCRDAVVLVPGAWIRYRHSILPFTQAKKIRQVLSMALDADFPDPETDVLLDFLVLPAAIGSGQHLILSAALARSRMEEIFHPLSAMGIRPRLTAPGGYARAVAFAGRQTVPDTFLYVDLAPTETSLTLFVEGRPLAARTLNAVYGQPDLAESDLAESDLDEPDLDRLAGDIRRTLAGTAFRANLPIETLSDIFLAPSDSDRIPGDRIARICSRLTQKLVPFFEDGNAPNVSPVMDPEAWYRAIAPERRPDSLFNFCSGPYGEGAFFKRFKVPLAACLLLLCLSFGLGIFGLERHSAALENQIARVRQTSMDIYKETFPGAAVPPGMPPLILMESKIKQAMKQAGPDTGDTTGALSDVKVIDLLHDLSGRIPTHIDIEVTRLVLNHGRLILTGATANFNTVDRIKGLIQASPRVNTVTINSADADKTGGRVRFKFIVEI